MKLSRGYEPDPRDRPAPARDFDLAQAVRHEAAAVQNRATRRLAAHAMHQRTGATVAECARWLEEAGGDVERAVQMMRAGAR